MIGLTIIALGTHFPELAASIGNVLKEGNDMTIGSVMSSNVDNLLVVYSLPTLISPLPIDATVISRDFPVLLTFTVVLFIFDFGLSKAGNSN